MYIVQALVKHGTLIRYTFCPLYFFDSMYQARSHFDKLLNLKKKPTFFSSDICYGTDHKGCEIEGSLFYLRTYALSICDEYVKRSLCTNVPLFVQMWRTDAYTIWGISFVMPLYLSV